jgi:hypothetical protein
VLFAVEFYFWTKVALVVALAAFVAFFCWEKATGVLPDLGSFTAFLCGFLFSAAISFLILFS